jgi:hypothetical protein
MVSNGHERAGKWRDGLEDSMTPEDISKATAMARECMKSEYKKCFTSLRLITRNKDNYNVWS